MESKDIRVGMHVRIAKEWCDDEEERNYVYLVIEDRTNKDDGDMRWLVELLGTGWNFAPQQVVRDYMIEPIEP